MPASFFLLGYVLLVGSLMSAALGIQQDQNNAERNDADQTEVSHQPVSKVTDLKVTKLDCTQAEVKWLNPAGPVSGYSVVICAVNPLNTLDPLECQKRDQNETYLNLHQLKPNTTYQVRVAPFYHRKLRKSYGYEVAISFTTLAPPLLEDIEVRPLNSTTMLVKWKGVSCASIVIHICPVPRNGRECHIYQTGSHRSELRIENLEPGTLYNVVATFSTTASGHTHPGIYVSRNATTPPLAPSLDDFEVRPLNSTSLEVAWKSVSGAWIFIKVCPAHSNKEKCSNHSVRSERSQSTIGDLQPGTAYTVSVFFSTTADGLIDPGVHISKNVTTPAQGDGNSGASLTVLSRLLMFTSLFCFMIKISAMKHP